MLMLKHWTAQLQRKCVDFLNLPFMSNVEAKNDIEKRHAPKKNNNYKNNHSPYTKFDWCCCFTFQFITMKEFLVSVILSYEKYLDQLEIYNLLKTLSQRNPGITLICSYLRDGIKFPYPVKICILKVSFLAASMRLKKNSNHRLGFNLHATHLFIRTT